MGGGRGGSLAVAAQVGLNRRCLLALLPLRLNLACVCSLHCGSGLQLLIVHSGALLIASPYTTDQITNTI